MFVLLAKITLLDCLEEEVRYHEPQKWSESSILTSQKFYLSYSASQQIHGCFHASLIYFIRLIPQIWLPTRSMHEWSSWQAPWYRREGSMNVVRFNTSSKSRKNWNSKQNRIQFSIHYFITLGAVIVINTFSHIWEPEAPMKLLNLRYPHRSATKTFIQWAPII